MFVNPAYWLYVQSGFTPLHIASHYGNISIGRFLIDKGADVNYKARVCRPMSTSVRYLCPQQCKCKTSNSRLWNNLLIYPTRLVGSRRWAMFCWCFKIYFQWFLSDQLSQHLHDRSSQSLQIWQNFGCRWTIWSYVFRSLMGRCHGNYFLLTESTPFFIMLYLRNGMR